MRRQTDEDLGDKKLQPPTTLTESFLFTMLIFVVVLLIFVVIYKLVT